jgi:predicted regulator of Ras-like GTPase activity (Roadblock/LC7/MglB family)
MNKETIEALLIQFVSSLTEVQGVVMVSAQGQPLTDPIGISEASTAMMAGVMLHLAGCVSEQCQWHTVDGVTIQAQEGYLILMQCSRDLFLLIRASAVPSGYLQHQIQQRLLKLRLSLQALHSNETMTYLSSRPTQLINGNTGSPTSDDTVLAYAVNGFSTSVINGSTATDPTANGSAQHIPPLSPPDLPKRISLPPSSLDAGEIAFCQEQLAEIIGPIAYMICDRTLAQTPDLKLMDFVKALTQQIPDQQKALEFQQRVFGSRLSKHL